MYKFIVFEGGDGSGKTSLSNLLVKLLKDSDKSVIKTCEPRKSVIGNIIREYVTTGKITDNLIYFVRDNDILFKELYNMYYLDIFEHKSVLHLLEAYKIIKQGVSSEIDDNLMYNLLMADRYMHIQWIEQQIKMGFTVVCDRYIYSTMVYQNSLIDKILLDYKTILKPDLVVFCRSTDDDRIFRNRTEFDKFETTDKIQRYNKLYDEIFTNLIKDVNVIGIDTTGDVTEVQSTFKQIMKQMDVID